MSAEEERTLGWNIVTKNCGVSRDKLYHANTALVVAIAKNYEGRGLKQADLIEGGLAGLRLAIEDYDPSRGARFSTSASWWIKHELRRLIAARSPPRQRSERAAP